MAEVIPFPSVRRRDEIEQLALLLLDHKAVAAERILLDRLARRRNSFVRKGIAPEKIRADIAAFEGAVRAAIWRHTLQGDGGAA